MGSVKKLKAYLNLTEKVEIGEMIENKNSIYFKYHPDFLDLGLEISPFKMKLSNAVLQPKEQHFDGVFGVFSDSIPDGWGKLLLDRKLLSMGNNLSDISPLDRLAYLDQNAIGALTYQPDYENEFINFNSVDLDEINSQIALVLSGSSKDVLDELFLLGGSSGGARPKIMVGYNSKTDEILYGKKDLPDGFEHWIIKFPSSSDFKDIALIEYAYNQMAQNAGIEVNDFRLFKSKTGVSFFGSKRFDRIFNKKLHLHSVCGLLHDNFRMSTVDYGHIMDCAFSLEKDWNAYSKILRLATFNVLAHNRDDHSKNFSFLMDENGLWKFAPAYDLTFSNSSFGFHSTTVAGESKNPTVKHLEELANHFGVKNCAVIIDDVKNALSQFNKLGNDLEISKDSLKLISSNLNI